MTMQLSFPSCLTFAHEQRTKPEHNTLRNKANNNQKLLLNANAERAHVQTSTQIKQAQWNKANVL